MGYPKKFREHVFGVKKQEKLTYEETAKRFRVGIASLMRWAKRLAPKDRRNKPTKIDMAQLAKDVEKNPDAYQYERAARLGVSQRTVGRGLLRLGVTYKKNPSSTRRQTLLPGKLSKKRLKTTKDLRGQSFI